MLHAKSKCVSMGYGVRRVRMLTQKEHKQYAETFYLQACSLHAPEFWHFRS